MTPENETPKPAKARHIPIRENWLALRSEPPVDPLRPIIDCHHHLWDQPGNRYLLDEICTDISGSGHNVVATVFVEAAVNHRKDGDPALRSLVETDMIAGIADGCDLPQGRGVRIASGIVGFVELALGARAGEVLDLHIEAAHGRFRGVRNASAWHEDPEARGSVLLPPPGLLYDPAFREGLAALTERGLTFDAWMYHTQLDELADLAHDFPDARIVLNHVGGPIGIGPYAGRRAEVFRDWLRGIRALAEFDNICVKLGGFGMLMAGFDFHDRPAPPSSDRLTEAWGPYMRACIDAFAPSRCMFESNFPVDKGTTSYAVMWNAFKKIAAGYSESEKTALFFGTANSVYNLNISQKNSGKGELPATDNGE